RPADATRPPDAARDGGDGGIVCAAGTTLCGTACVDTRSNPANCGACGRACPAATVCAAGVCQTTCTVPGTTNCAGACVDLTNNAANCAACGRACTDGQLCVASTCACTQGTRPTLCNARCVDVAADPNNCGACGTVCQPPLMGTGGPLCSAGQ